MATKQEVRELTKADPFLQRLQAVGTAVKSHQSAVLASVAVLVLLGAGVAIASNRAEKTHEAASKQFGDAQKTFDKAPTPGQSAADTPADGFKSKDEWRVASATKFEQLQKDHPDSGAARISRLYLAQLAMDKGEAAAAVEHYRAFLQGLKAEDPMFAPATLGLAAALEDAGKTEEALAEYRRLAPFAEGGQKPLGDEALMGIARLLEKSGKNEEARETYERVTKDYPASMLRYKAQAKMAALPK